MGISQSLFGTFYGEGGVGAIVILSIIYAYLINAMMVKSIRFNSDTRHLIKGATIASIIPLLRGGDLPGIYAFIGMSFWPVILFVNRYASFAFRFQFARFMARRTQPETNNQPLKEEQEYVEN